MTKMKSAYLAILTILLSPMAANADLIALDIVSEGTAALDDRKFTLGWAFSVSEEITVAALGTWDQGSDGLQFFQTVSLWTAAGAFLSSVIVDNAATPVASAEPTGNPANPPSGRWLFVDLVADIVLGSGDYVIGANRFGGVTDVFQFEDTGIVMDSRVTFVEDRHTIANAPFGFPTLTNKGTVFEGTQFFGPTFSIADAVAPVPEPGSLTLFGLGLAGLGLMRRRRKV